ncbi:hypothetical protein C9374_011538 [Naegleria lovaniensis]|uniref:N-acetyltransferase domain-containing protein n=1 Tax=Naegleria lovaniensis TaxID=51637 RepID=A0AA88KP50_NAELO|nr:uncharacterized protein C9374_011538 [Naegleria lovaniensis]KAG2392813.1 hypothetical protein C9374_011538 [Naegleria lovaniensis]
MSIHTPSFALIPSSQVVLEGKYITLQPCQPSQDASELYDMSHGSPEKESIWEYLYMGGSVTPFPNVQEFQQLLEKRVATSASSSTTPVPNRYYSWTVVENQTRMKIGNLCLMNAYPDHGRIEIGAVWVAKPYHRTNVNTEACFLLMCYAFEVLQYSRVEWKCDERNKRSSGAAKKMGFSYEGTFRKHMIVRDGFARNTDWYSIIDEDWFGGKKKLYLQHDRLKYEKQDDERLANMIQYLRRMNGNNKL